MADRGGQKGNQNAVKGNRWRDALNKALAQFTDARKKVQAGQALDRIAKEVVKEALEGSYWAIDEIACRLDGKAAQTLHVTNETPNARELTDAEILDRLQRLERGGDAQGTPEPPPSAPNAPGVH
jgi:hypothetical protein